MTGLTALQPLVGEWSTRIEMLFPTEAAGQILAAKDTYRWAPGGRFLIHDVDAQMPDGRAQSFEVYAVATNGEGYQSRNYGADGAVGDYKASLVGARWTIVGERERFEGAFEGADRLAGLWRLKQGQSWVDWMRVTLTRIS